MIEARATGLPDVLILETPVYGDGRGSFLECYNERDFRHATGISATFVQDNYSESLKHVVRGLHYQVERPQGKLVRVLSGEIYDVMVDVRASSVTRGQWHGERLSGASGRMLWIPPGYAHGFLVLSQTAGVFYKTTEYWAPELERSVRWDDPDLAIDWPSAGTPLLSAKDARAPRFRDAEPIA